MQMKNRYWHWFADQYQYFILNKQAPLIDRAVTDNCNFVILFQRHYVPFPCIIFHVPDRRRFFQVILHKNYSNQSHYHFKKAHKVLADS